MYDDLSSFDPDDPYGSHPLFEPRRPEQAWRDAPVLTLTPDLIRQAGDDLAARLAAHPGPIALAGLGDWPAVALEDARYHLSCEPLSRPARLDGAEVDLDTALDALVAALDDDESPARRVRPEGMSPGETERVVSIMYQDDGRGRFYADRARQPLTEDLLYDVFEEDLFEAMEGL